MKDGLPPGASARAVASRWYSTTSRGLSSDVRKLRTPNSVVSCSARSSPARSTALSIHARPPNSFTVATLLVGSTPAFLPAVYLAGSRSVSALAASQRGDRVVCRASFSSPRKDLLPVAVASERSCLAIPLSVPAIQPMVSSLCNAATGGAISVPCSLCFLATLKQSLHTVLWKHRPVGCLMSKKELTGRYLPHASPLQNLSHDEQSGSTFPEAACGAQMRFSGWLSFAISLGSTTLE